MLSGSYLYNDINLFFLRAHLFMACSLCILIEVSVLLTKLLGLPPHLFAHLHVHGVTKKNRVY